MAQAGTQNSDRSCVGQQHFALNQDQEYKLRHLGLVVNGIRALAHDGDIATASDAIDIRRQDLAAIFELIADEINAVMVDMQPVRNH